MSLSEVYRDECIINNSTSLYIFISLLLSDWSIIRVSLRLFEIQSDA